MNHFRPHIEKDLIGDVLAGERRPSYEKMTHIPNRKVFYVRFIKPEGEEVVSDSIASLERNCKVRNHNEFYLHFELTKSWIQNYLYAILLADFSVHSR